MKHNLGDPETLGLLRPNFFNKPKVDEEDDICDVHNDWGEKWYGRHFPKLLRTESDEYVSLKKFHRLS